MIRKNIIKTIASVFAAVLITGMTAFTAFATGEAAEGAAQQPSGGGWSLFIMIGGMILVMFIMSRPQKKKEREAKAMQDNLQIGDEVVTIGGIIGLVIRKGDDNVVIETGGDRSKIRVQLWAISENRTAMEKAEAAKNEMKKNRGIATSPDKNESSKKKSEGKD